MEPSGAQSGNSEHTGGMYTCFWGPTQQQQQHRMDWTAHYTFNFRTAKNILGVSSINPCRSVSCVSQKLYINCIAQEKELYLPEMP
jgi:hypothetical protein